MAAAWIGAWLAAALLASATYATDYLVKPGEDWERLGAKLRPGDQILLMPGVHQAATLEGVEGTSERPIRIAGMDPNAPSVIEGELYGLRLNEPKHVRIENLVLRGAKFNGLRIDGDLPPMPAQDEWDTVRLKGLPSRDVLVRNVRVVETSEKGLRHGINLRYLEDVRIIDCEVEAWAGSGIEVLGCRGVMVENVKLTGRDEYAALSGIRVVGGSDQVRIERCMFTDCGDQGVSIGGSTDLVDHWPPVNPEAEPGSVFEASRVQVERCVFRGGLTAMAFVHCDQATVMNNTIIRPRKFIVSIRSEHEDKRFGAPRMCTFGSNLITWEPGDIERLTHLAGRIGDTTIALDENLWWVDAPLTAYEGLGSFPGQEQVPQVLNVDPELDEDGRPRAEGAKRFGAAAE